VLPAALSFGAAGAPGTGGSGESGKTERRLGGTQGRAHLGGKKTAGEPAADSHGNRRRTKVVAVFRHDSGDEMRRWGFSTARWSF
jgi:hypothetical protein